jgi:hypothetical protein
MNGDISIPGVDDGQDFLVVKKAMETLGITASERDDIFRLVSTVLMLGNIQFFPVEGADHVSREEEGKKREEGGRRKEEEEGKEGREGRRGNREWMETLIF